MSPVQALRSVLRGFTDFDGRASRSEYWWWQGWLLLGAVAWWTLWASLPVVAELLAVVLLLAIIVPGLAVLVRRLHDTGRSGGWILVGLIPLLGELTLLYFTLKDSEDGPNAWGPPPPGSSFAEPVTWAPTLDAGLTAEGYREERPARKWAGIAIAVVIWAVLVASSFSWVPSAVLAPVLGYQRVERPTDGFAISLPRDWEYAVAAEADPKAWWDSEVADPNETHERFLSQGGVLMSRQATPLAVNSCHVSDITSLAAEPPVFITLADAVDNIMLREDDPEVVSVDSAVMDLPAGRVASVDTMYKDGLDERDYVFKDGKAWFLLQCFSTSAPEDRWLSIAETFEFLPVRQPDTSHSANATHDARAVLDELRNGAEPSGP
jgi:uncharacterized membrane protein YhaH (DUF805 family)